jgi:hypothetical protein
LAQCPACGGVVAIGAKTCPHCGKSKPAPKPPTKATWKHVLIAFSVVAFFIFIGGQESPQLTAAQVTDICAREAGMDPRSTRPVTMQDIRALDACLKRYGFDTSKR